MTTNFQGLNHFNVQLNFYRFSLLLLKTGYLVYRVYNVK